MFNRKEADTSKGINRKYYCQKMLAFQPYQIHVYK